MHCSAPSIWRSIFYTWIIIASAIFSWLYAFNVVNSSNRFVASVGEFLYKVTEPVLRPIRNLLPNLGGIDISADHPSADYLLHPPVHVDDAAADLMLKAHPEKGETVFG